MHSMDKIKDQKNIQLDGTEIDFQISPINSMGAHTLIENEYLQEISKEDFIDDIEKIDTNILPAQLISERTPYGNILNFLMTTSVIRSLLLWPFLRKDGIIHFSKQPIASYNSIPNDQNFEKKNSEELDDSAALIPNTNNMPGCNRIFTLYGGILFQSEDALKRSLGVMAFHEATEIFVNIIWGAFLSSLLINGLVNYSLYPDEREGTTVWNVLGLTSLLNIICIEKIDFFKNYLCYRQGKSYDDILASSLDLPYIWPVVLGVPILSGIVHAVWQAKGQRKSVAELMNGLTITLQKHSAWHNVYYWIFAVVIPDVFSVLFPPAILLKALCATQTDINDILDQMRDAIIWNGSITASDRKELCQKLISASQFHIGLTQLKVLSILADIIDGINEKNLLLLEEVNLSNSETIILIETQRGIKKAAFNNLCKVANKENRNEDERTEWLNYLYANYLMWRLGYPQKNWPLQFLFFPYKLFKLYFTLMFYRTILSGFIEIINRKLEEKECLNANKVWLWYQEFNKYICSVCGDLPIPFRQISSVEDCLQGYLQASRKSEELLKFINRFDLGNISKLDLSEQNQLLLNQTELFIFLRQLKPKLLNLRELYLVTSIISDNMAFIEFVQNSSFNALTFRKQISAEEFTLLVKSLPNTNITQLYLECPKKGYSMKLFGQGIINSSITDLDLTECPIPRGVGEIQTFADILPISKLEKVRGVSIITVDTTSGYECFYLAMQLTKSKVHYLELSFKNLFRAVVSCPVYFAKALSNMSHNLSLIYSDYTEVNTCWQGELLYNDGVDIFAELLSRVPPVPLNKLALNLFNVNPDHLLALINALPNSQLTHLELSFDGFIFKNCTNGLNISFIPDLVNALNQSLITAFGYGGKNLNSNGIEFFAAALPKKLNKLTQLRLGGMREKPMNAAAIKAIGDALPYTNLDTLLFYLQSEESLKTFLGNLSKTNITFLDIKAGKISINDLDFFVSQLNKSKIELLNLSDNDIDEDGALVIFGGLHGSAVKHLELPVKITDRAAVAMSKILVKHLSTKHELWIDLIDSNRKKALIYEMIPSTNLSELAGLYGIGEIGAQAICDILPYTDLLPHSLIKGFLNVSDSTLRDCGFISAANLHHPIGPYLLLARFYLFYKKSILEAILYQYKLLADKSNNILVENRYNISSEPIENLLLFAFHPINHLQQRISIFDISTYQGYGTIIINLEVKLPIRSTVNIPENITAIIGNQHSNHFIIANKNTYINLSQSYGNNLLIIGESGRLELGSHSRNHIILQPEIGSIKIFGFNHRTILHIIDKQTIYADSPFICREINSLAILQLRGTQVQLENISCESLSSQIIFNNQTALQQAQAEVFQTSGIENNLLYQSVLDICGTFLNSVGKSAFLTATPKFVTEILYRVGGLSRDAAEASGREIQLTLTLSMTNAPTSMMASYLAGYLTAQLTNSPQIISGVSMGASIVSSVIEILWTQDVSFGWIALQTGIALAGAGVGNMLIEKTAPITSELVSRGWNKANQVHSYAKNYFKFWRKELTTQITEVLLPLSSVESRKVYN